MDDDTVVLLFVGKLIEKKNPAVIMDAISRLRTGERRRLGLVYVGSGPLEAELRFQANSVRDRVRFVSFQNQSVMPTYYRVGDILVLPSSGPRETWGLVVNEAMSCARPAIVSSKVGSAADLIEPGRTGFVFDAADVGSLANVLRKTVELDRSGLRQLGVKAAKRIRKFSYRRAATLLEEALIAN